MYKFIAKDGFVPGIPARDMTDAEVDAHDLVKDIKASPCYKHEPDEPAVAEAPAEEAPARARGRRAQEGESED